MSSPRTPGRVLSKELQNLLGSPGSGGRSNRASGPRAGGRGPAARATGAQSVQRAAVSPAADGPVHTRSDGPDPVQAALAAQNHPGTTWLAGGDDDRPQVKVKLDDLLDDDKTAGSRIIAMKNLADFITGQTVHRECAAAQTRALTADFVEFCTNGQDHRRASWLRERLAAFELAQSDLVDLAAGPGHGVLTLDKEHRRGLSSDFQFSCSKCETGAAFCTSKKVEKSASRPQHQLHEVNLLASYAALNVGRGSGDVFSQCAIQNIPLDRNSYIGIYNRAQKVFGKALEATTNECLDENIAEYKAAAAVAAACAEELGNEIYMMYKKKQVNGVWYQPVIGSIDGCWDKRSSGHTFDSNHGSVTLWAHLPDGRRIPVMIRQYMIRCFACNVWRSKREGIDDDTGVVPEDVKRAHDCRENHRGDQNLPRNSKSMEAQGAVDIGLAAIQLGMFVDVLIMDDDSSVPAAMCLTGTNHVKAAADVCQMPPGLECSRVVADPSHRLRSQGNKFFALHKKGRLVGEETGDSRFTKQCAIQFKKYVTNIAYSARQQGRETGDWAAAREDYRKATRQAVEHGFGRHTAEESELHTALLQL